MRAGLLFRLGSVEAAEPRKGTRQPGTKSADTEVCWVADCNYKEGQRMSEIPGKVAGHYGRPDIFRLEIDRRPKPPILFVDERE